MELLQVRPPEILAAAEETPLQVLGDVGRPPGALGQVDLVLQASSDLDGTSLVGAVVVESSWWRLGPAMLCDGSGSWLEHGPVLEEIIAGQALKTIAQRPDRSSSRPSQGRTARGSVCTLVAGRHLSRLPLILLPFLPLLLRLLAPLLTALRVTSRGAATDTAAQAAHLLHGILAHRDGQPE